MPQEVQGVGRPSDVTQKVAIYAIIDEKGDVRYIGKSYNPQERFKQHLRMASKRTTPVYSWLRKIKESGITPSLKIIEWCLIDNWQQREIYWIAMHRNTGKLLNVADGGNQPTRPKGETRKRIQYIKQQIYRSLKGGFVSENAKTKLRLAAAKAPHLFGEWATL